MITSIEQYSIQEEDTKFIKGSEKCIEQAIEIHNKNINYFREKGVFSNVIDSLLTIEKDSDIHLIVAEDKLNNIKSNNNEMYTDEQLNYDYYKNASNDQLGIFDIAIIDYSLKIRLDILQSYKKIQEEVYKKTGKMIIDGEDNTKNRDASFVINVGLNLGYSLFEILKRKNPCYILIADINLYNLYYSTFSIKWYELLADYPSDRVIFLPINNDPQIAFSQIGTTMKQVSPFCGLSLTICRISNHGIARDIVHNSLTSTQLLVGMSGFFSDEIVMAQNSYLNLLTNSVRKLTYPSLAIEDTPVFVFASGPSLERDIENAKKYQHKAVIIAAGSAITALFEYGIKPDFYIWLENDSCFADRILDISRKYDISDVCLVTTATTIPISNGFGKVHGIEKLFKDHIVYIRETVSSPLWDPQRKANLLLNAPTVANTAFSFAQFLGTQEIYLFGFDLGSRDKNKHHVKAVYNTYDTEDNETISNTLQHPVNANFDGIVYTGFPYKESIDMLNMLVSKLNLSSLKLDIYNCSDGAYIQGTKTKDSTTIDLSKVKSRKEIKIDRTINSQHKISRNKIKKHWINLDLANNIDESTKELEDFIKDDTRDWLDVSIFAELSDFFQVDDYNSTDGIFKPLIKGSAIEMMYMLEAFLIRLEKKEELTLVTSLIRKEFLKFIHTAKQEFIRYVKLINIITLNDNLDKFILDNTPYNTNSSDSIIKVLATLNIYAFSKGIALSTTKEQTYNYLFLSLLENTNLAAYTTEMYYEKFPSIDFKTSIGETPPNYKDNPIWLIYIKSILRFQNKQDPQYTKLLNQIDLNLSKNELKEKLNQFTLYVKDLFRQNKLVTTVNPFKILLSTIREDLFAYYDSVEKRGVESKLLFSVIQRQLSLTGTSVLFAQELIQTLYNDDELQASNPYLISDKIIPIKNKFLESDVLAVRLKEYNEAYTNGTIKERLSKEFSFLEDLADLFDTPVDKI